MSGVSDWQYSCSDVDSIVSPWYLCSDCGSFMTMGDDNWNSLLLIFVGYKDGCIMLEVSWIAVQYWVWRMAIPFPQNLEKWEVESIKECKECTPTWNMDVRSWTSILFWSLAWQQRRTKERSISSNFGGIWTFKTRHVITLTHTRFPYTYQIHMDTNYNSNLIHKHKIGLCKSEEPNLWARREKNRVRGKTRARSQVDNAVNRDCTAQSPNDDQDTHPKLQGTFSKISLPFITFSKKIQRRLPKSVTADSNLKTANQYSNWKLVKCIRGAILTL